MMESLMKTKTILLILLGLCLAWLSSAGAAEDVVSILAPEDGKVVRIDVELGEALQVVRVRHERLATLRDARHVARVASSVPH